MFTEGIGIELDSLGSAVRVQALCPGFTYSGFHDVMGIDREGIAKNLWLSAQSVVDASLEEFFGRGRRYVVPGWRYKVFTAIVPHLPRWLLASMAMKAAQRAKRV